MCPMPEYGIMFRKGSWLSLLLFFFCSGFGFVLVFKVMLSLAAGASNAHETTCLNYINFEHGQSLNTPIFTHVRKWCKCGIFGFLVNY